MTYTPTTDEVEHRYAYDELYSMDCEADHHAFRRWLKAHDAEVAARALGDAADELDLPGSTATGYYASEQDSGYRDAERDAENWLRARADRIERGE